MSKPRLNADELYYIQQNEADISHLLKCIEAAKRFNVGDYLIRYERDSKTPELNSYSTPRSFQVVHVDVNGVSYVKEVMGNKTSSWIMTLASFHGSSNASVGGNSEEFMYHYALDPLYEDHILMSQEGKYDPGSLQRDKSKLHKEITAFNKTIKVRAHSYSEAFKFLKTVKVGDTLWFSNVTSFIVQEIKPFKGVNANNYDSHLKPILIGVTNKGKNLKLSMNDIVSKAVYTACPRSYKELKT